MVKLSAKNEPNEPKANRTFGTSENRTFDNRTKFGSVLQTEHSVFGHPL